jgi:amino acid adenylation domain-containing protein
LRTIEFISYLRSVGIELSAEGGRLQCRASRGVLTPELKSEIASRKNEIITVIRAAIGRAAAPIARTPRSGDIPLSHSQERLWMLDQFVENFTPYHTQIALRLWGPLDADALEKSFRAIIARHEVLRTAFDLRDAHPIQIIASPETVEIRRADISELNPLDREDEIRRIQREEISRRFDLKRGPMIRPLIVRLGEGDHALFVTLHHIIFDGWSFGILSKELSAFYSCFSSGGVSPLPDLPIQYADFAVWQRAEIQGDALAEHLAYWKRRLEGISALNIETDHPRPRVPSYRGVSAPFDMSASVRAAVASLCRERLVTPFMVFLAAFQTLLHRYSGQNDIVVGSTVAARNRVEIEPLIGMFTNTLVLRTDFSGDPPFVELLHRVRTTLTEAFEHQEVPFEKLVEVLHPERDMSRHPLFQVMLVYLNVSMQPVELPGLAVEPILAGHGTIPFDLTLGLQERNEGIAGCIDYSTDLFDDGTIRRMIAHLQVLLEGIVRDPDRRISALPMITGAERHLVLRTWNDPSAEYRRDTCVHELFEHRVEQSPDATAVAGEGYHLTYRELDRRANRLAHHLCSFGAGPETRVGIYLVRSIDTVIAVLAVLKAGAAYIPLDPSYPSERISFMIEDAGPAVIVTTESLSRTLPKSPLRIVRIDADREAIARENSERPMSGASSRDLAYVIYTSGSTGRPKGVLVEHGGVCNCAEAQIEAYGVGPADRVLQFASPSFDASVSEMFMAILSGATLCVEPPDSTLPGGPLAAVLRERDVTVVTLPPSSLALMPPGPFPALGTLIVAGEAFGPDVISAWMAGRKVINAYGPTEATICATHERCRVGDNPVPIGKPIANARVYILDRLLEPVPPGVPGELYIGGGGVARGYRRGPSRTAEHFLPDPFSAAPGRRMYRTGDMARYRSDGEIMFLGRADSQVKIRGFRIEPGEIETALRRHPAIRDCAVVAFDGENARQAALVSFYVSGESLSSLALRRFLRGLLPTHMVPAEFIPVDAIPRTTSGKVDYGRLKGARVRTAEETRVHTPPESRSERAVAAIWRDVLNVTQIGLDDNFFDLGGYSLLVVKAIARIEEKLGITLRMVDFIHLTLRQMARTCEERKESGARNT